MHKLSMMTKGTLLILGYRVKGQGQLQQKLKWMLKFADILIV